jgi:hypothetical protein
MVQWLIRHFGGGLLVACLITSPTWAQEHGGHNSESHEEHFHRNELALVLASTYEVEHSKNLFTIGGEYERRLTPRFGVAATVEFLDSIDARVLVFPVTVRVVRGLKVVVGPGWERKSRRPSSEGHEDPHDTQHEDSHAGDPVESGTENLFLFRFGVHYGFEFGGRYSITPGIDLDLISEDHGVAKAILYGVNFGIAF